MIIETKYHGKISVPQESIIRFVKPLIALEDFRFFVIYQSDEFQGGLWMQSMEYKELTFLIADPRSFYPDYRLRIDNHDNDLKALETDSIDNLSLYSIIRQDKNQLFINLLGPILINDQNNFAIQAISSEDYPPDYLIYDANQMNTQTSEKPH